MRKPKMLKVTLKKFEANLIEHRITLTNYANHILYYYEKSEKDNIITSEKTTLSHSTENTARLCDLINRLITLDGYQIEGITE